nr:AraC family transcriptional regulator [Bacteroidota bacterium]
MSYEELHIKNMVCNRCIKVVNEELTKLGFTIKSIELGKVELGSTIDEKDLDSIKLSLEANGFELLSDKKSRIISKIKTEIIKAVHYGVGVRENINFSDFLSRQVGNDYSYISSLFSSTEGITIEKYLILQKIERAKELLVYDELSLSEIAIQLDYSSVQYLSNQFKKITGLTPTHFKKIQKNKRLGLDKLLKTKNNVNQFQDFVTDLQ